MMRGLGAALLPLVAACKIAAPPDRSATYEFTIRLETGFPLVFRWPTVSLPVRVWAEPGLDLEWHVTQAIGRWQAAVLYGEFRGTLVDDSSAADVIIRIGDIEAVEPQSQRLACAGATRIEVGLDTAIALPFRTTITPRFGHSPQDVHACVGTIVTHELGHVLGLFLHSDDPGDLMHGRPTSDGLSVRDVATLETLYHSPPTVHLPPGR